MTASPATSRFRMRSAQLASAPFEVDDVSLAQGRKNLVALLLLGGSYPCTVFPLGHRSCFRFSPGTERVRPLYDDRSKQILQVPSGEIVLRVLDQAGCWITLRPLVAYFTDSIFRGLPSVVGQCAYLGDSDLTKNGAAAIQGRELVVTWLPARNP